MLSIEGAEHLYKVCETHQISDYAKSDLEMQVEYLRIYKKLIHPIKKTETQRAKALKNVETLSADLRKAVEGLCFEDRLALDCEYFRYDEPGFGKCLELVENAKSFDVAGDLIPRLEVSAQTVLNSLQNVSKSGKPKSTESQADFIRCIAQALKSEKIKPSYNGPFLEICKAIFEDAGITFPDRALRYFMEKLRPNLKAGGYCL